MIYLKYQNKNMVFKTKQIETNKKNTSLATTIGMIIIRILEMDIYDRLEYSTQLPLNNYK